MEGKVLLQDLAQSLAAKRKMQKKDAEAFLKAFFETISNGILDDKIVKIKGLGTFKMIEVQDRESVNVNTGERIVIPGHSKISFTPDAELKDEVNKPFALFQTVIINDGTSIEDMEKVDVPPVDNSQVIEDSQNNKTEESVAVQEPVVSDNQPIASVVEEPVIPTEPETPVVPEESVVPVTPVATPASEAPAEPKIENVSSLTSQPTVSCKHSWWYISPAMTALLFAFFWIVLLVGYFVGSNNWVYLEKIFNRPTQETVVQIDTVLVEKLVEPDSVYIQGLEDSLRNVISQETKVKKELPKTLVQQPAKTEAKPVAVTKKSPVAFEIVGYKGTRTIQWGDYLLKIVRQEYGTEDALKYVISYNNFTNPDNLPVGTEIKLPKLKEK
ncbi:MAG: HU family DNA-binding protein [Bacteroidaceae bacterium]|nr:HU family DNA-binding protein [Bacteroidaceae bacterium]